jgi:hypothetical protein
MRAGDGVLKANENRHLQLKAEVVQCVGVHEENEKTPAICWLGKRNKGK